MGGIAQLMFLSYCSVMIGDRNRSSVVHSWDAALALALAACVIYLLLVSACALARSATPVFMHESGATFTLALSAYVVQFVIASSCAHNKTHIFFAASFFHG